MRFTTATIAAILAFTSSVTAAPLETRQESWKDFKVTKVEWSPASGAGNSDGSNVLRVTITDPNEIRLNSRVTVPASTVNCEAKWNSKNSESPLRSWKCDATELGYWDMQVLPGSEGYFNSIDFGLRFLHNAIVYESDVGYITRLHGEGNFARDKNLKGVCGAGGSCFWQLRPENTPALLSVEQVH